MCEHSGTLCKCSRLGKWFSESLHHFLLQVFPVDPLNLNQTKHSSLSLVLFECSVKHSSTPDSTQYLDVNPTSNRSWVSGGHLLTCGLISPLLCSSEQPWPQSQRSDVRTGILQKHAVFWRSVITWRKCWMKSAGTDALQLFTEKPEVEVVCTIEQCHVKVIRNMPTDSSRSGSFDSCFWACLRDVLLHFKCHQATN